MRNRAPSPRPKPSSISARSTGSVIVAASASSCTHMPMTSTLSPASFISARDARFDLGDRVELVLADVDHGEHRPVGEQEVRLERSRDVGLQAGAVERAALGERRRTRPGAPRSRRRATCRASPGAGSWCSRFSTVSRSARASSISTTRRCSSGSDGPVTSSSSNARSTNTMASTSRMLARNLLPRPSPLLAPSTRPPMSTTWTAAWTIVFVLRHHGQPVEPVVGHLGDTDVRVLGGERVRRGQRTAAGECVVQRALARVGETDQAEAFHEPPRGYRPVAAPGPPARPVRCSSLRNRSRGLQLIPQRTARRPQRRWITRRRAGTATTRRCPAPTVRRPRGSGRRWPSVGS